MRDKRIAEARRWMEENSRGDVPAESANARIRSLLDILERPMRDPAIDWASTITVAADQISQDITLTCRVCDYVWSWERDGELFGPGHYVAREWPTLAELRDAGLAHQDFAHLETP